MNRNDFEQNKKDLNHIGRNNPKLRVHLTRDDIDVFNTYYGELLGQVNDEDEREKIETELLLLISEAVNKHRMLAVNKSIPTKEKRNQKLNMLLKSIQTVIDSMDEISGDVDREEYQKRYLEYLHKHYAQVNKLLKDEIPIDIEFNTRDSKRRKKADKTKIKKYLTHLKEKKIITITKNEIEDLIRYTPPYFR